MHLNFCLKNISTRNLKGKGSISKNTCCRNKLLCGCPAWKNMHFKLPIQKTPASTEKGRKQLDHICCVSPGCKIWAIYKHAYIIPLVLQDNRMFSFWSLTGSLVDYCLSGWQHWTTQQWSAPRKAGGAQTAWFLSPAINHHYPQANWHCSWHLQKKDYAKP